MATIFPTSFIAGDGCNTLRRARTTFVDDASVRTTSSYQVVIRLRPDYQQIPQVVAVLEQLSQNNTSRVEVSILTNDTSNGVVTTLHDEISGVTHVVVHDKGMSLSDIEDSLDIQMAVNSDNEKRVSGEPNISASEFFANW